MTYGDELSFHWQGLCVSGSAHITNGGSLKSVVKFNCQTGVALPMGFPGQVSGRKEGK